MLKIGTNADTVAKDLSGTMPGKIKRATVYALNDTADDVLSAVQARMRSRFDRPTRFTQGAFMVWRARTSDPVPTSEVKERPSLARRNYLKTQESGGERQLTGLERALQTELSRISSFHALVPAAGAKLDQSGNWSAGERRAALAGLKSRRAVGKRRYFVPGKGSPLPPGIYAADRSGAVSPLAALVSKTPRYRPLLGFLDGAKEELDDKFPRHFDRILLRLMSGS